MIDLNYPLTEDLWPLSLVEEVLKATGLELIVPEQEIFIKLLTEQNYLDVLYRISNIAFIEFKVARRRLKTFMLIMGMCNVAKCEDQFTCWFIFEELAHALSGIISSHEYKISIFDIPDMWQEEGIQELKAVEVHASSEANIFTEEIQLSKQYLIDGCEFIIAGVCKN